MLECDTGWLHRSDLWWSQDLCHGNSNYGFRQWAKNVVRKFQSPPMVLVRGCNKLALVASPSGWAHMGATCWWQGTGMAVAAGWHQVTWVCHTAPSHLRVLLCAPGSSSHVSVHKMVLENTGFKPQACFDFNLWWLKKKKRIFNRCELTHCTFWSCRDGLWSLISVSGTVRLVNTGMLVLHILSSHTSKERKYYLFTHPHGSGITISSFLWEHTECCAQLGQCLSPPICGAASAQPQLRCTCAAWRVPAKPRCSPDRWGRNILPWVLCSWTDSSSTISPW